MIIFLMGSLMQLIAYGAQDIYLTGNPPNTFSNVVYGKHTNIGDLIKHGYDPEKYNYMNDELYIRYSEQLKELKAILNLNTSDSIYIVKIIEGNTECPVTFETIEDKYYYCTQCKQNFHNSVIDNWIKKYMNCPHCRYNFNDRETKYVYSKNNIDNMYTKEQLEFVKKRIEILEELISKRIDDLDILDEEYQKEIIDRALLRFEKKEKKEKKKEYKFKMKEYKHKNITHKKSCKKNYFR